jgi:1-acyl-sn-glycerol-3-phosphate acyltransferase
MPEPLGGDTPNRPTWGRALIDLGVTLLLWTYFTIGFVVAFSPWYLIATALPRRRSMAFQALNHYFFRGFFGLCRGLIPRFRWQVDPSIVSIRSAVVVCNHLSYIDSIFLISLFKHHSTIVKARLFGMPILGLLLRLSGYIPSEGKGALVARMMRRLETLGPELSQGANLIVFPEGTRSRSGVLGPFQPGAFKLARMFRLPIQVLRIRHSNRLFQPGRFLFNTGDPNVITLDVVAQITPDYDAADFSLTTLMEQTRLRMLDDV